MQVKLTRDFRCAPEGHTVVTIPAGTEVSGRVAQWAIQQGAASAPKKTTPRPQTVKPAKPESEG